VKQVGVFLAVEEGLGKKKMEVSQLLRGKGNREWGEDS